MLLEDILMHNYQFVEKEDFTPYETSGIPDKHALILTCMDTRLTELLPKAMDFKNGDVKILKTAGATIENPYGSIMRSILIAVHALEVDEIFVVGHHDCGLNRLDSEHFVESMIAHGIEEETLNHLPIHPTSWFKGFDCIQAAIKSTVSLIEKHPLMPDDIPVHGLVIDPKSGKIDVIINGYQ